MADFPIAPVAADALFRRRRGRGVKAYTVYNRMLLPTMFESVEADYRHLKDHVQVWDVAVRAAGELRGPDAGRLMQMLTPRDLRGCCRGSVTTCRSWMKPGAC